ncbi:MAG: DUF692 family protein [Candidatus Nitrosocaldaceae archaeon]
MNIPDRGVGLTYFLSLEPFIQSNIDLIDVIEIEPQNFWHHTLSDEFKMDKEVMEKIKNIPCKKIIHSVSIPIGGTVIPDYKQILLLNNIIKEIESPWISEHLSFNSVRYNGIMFNTGFLLPPIQSKRSVEYISRNINILKDEFQVPFAIETGVNYLKPNNNEVRDSEFVRMIVERSECGILLDLHNIWANELNGREKVEDFISNIPLDKVWEVHLAGGTREDNYWLDAHAGTIPDQLIEIAKNVIPRLRNLHAIIFELYPSYATKIEQNILREQLKILHSLWDIRGSDIREYSYESGIYNYNEPDYIPEEWEYTLARLVNGFKINTLLGDRLSSDPAIPLYNKLISSFRASMIARALPLTTRLLMLSLDIESILSDFWKIDMPKLFTTDEALSFIKYLEDLDLKIEYLKDILTLEKTILLCKIEDKNEIIYFKYNPLKVLESLLKMQLPSSVEPGIFEIKIGENGISNIDIADTNER